MTRFRSHVSLLLKCHTHATRASPPLPPLPSCNSCSASCLIILTSKQQPYHGFGVSQSQRPSPPQERRPHVPHLLASCKLLSRILQLTTPIPRLSNHLPASLEQCTCHTTAPAGPSRRATRTSMLRDPAACQKACARQPPWERVHSCVPYNSSRRSPCPRSVRRSLTPPPLDRTKGQWQLSTFEPVAQCVGDGIAPQRARTLP